MAAPTVDESPTVGGPWLGIRLNTACLLHIGTVNFNPGLSGFFPPDLSTSTATTLATA